MMNLKQVKSALYQTECKDYLPAGLYCSEPVLSKDEGGAIIDNYFVFSRSRDLSRIGAPEIAFGVDSDKCTTIYVDQSISNKFEKQLYEERFEDVDVMRAASERYQYLYPTIRKIAFTDSEGYAQEINEYLACWKAVSGETLYSFYQVLYPEFFAWAEKCSLGRYKDIYIK